MQAEPVEAHLEMQVELAVEAHLVMRLGLAVAEPQAQAWQAAPSAG